MVPRKTIKKEKEKKNIEPAWSSTSRFVWWTRNRRKTISICNHHHLTIKILLSKFVGWTRNRGKFNRKEKEKKEQSERNWRSKPIGHTLILELLNLEAIKQCVLILIRKEIKSKS